LTNFSGGAVTITYNGDSLRARKTAGGTNTYYLVDDRNPSGYPQVLEEWTANGGVTNLSRVYTYGLSLTSQKQGSTIYYFGTDGHGSTRLLLDNVGAVANAFAYDAYGSLIASNSTGQTTHFYCGEELDLDLGMYYVRARYYQPNTGRFWSMDTYEGLTGDPLSLHKYLYVECDPINKIDPSGQSWASVELGKAVHKFLSDKFIEKYRPFAITGVSVATALKKAGIPIDTIIAFLPDLVDLNPKHKEVYEIKPNGILQFGAGEAQLLTYLELFNHFDPAKGWKEGSDWMPPRAFFLVAPPVPPTVVVTTGPLFGVILYSSLSQYFTQKARNLGIEENAEIEGDVLGGILEATQGAF
jgi:RHS repeat-associated protein